MKKRRRRRRGGEGGRHKRGKVKKLPIRRRKRRNRWEPKANIGNIKKQMLRV